MGASVTAAVVAIGALAYALTLEGRILTNDARSLSTCNAVSFTKAYKYVPDSEPWFELNLYSFLSIFSLIQSLTQP